MKKELEVDCHAIYRYAEANNKYMKNYNRNIWIIIPHLFRCKQFVWMGNVSKITGKWFWMGKNVSKFVEEFIQNCDEDSNKWYILEVEVEYSKDFYNLHSDLPFLSERMKIKKCNKLVCNLYDKKKNSCSYKSSKTCIESWTDIKEVHRVIQFNQEAWLKPCIKTKAKNNIQKDFFKLRNNSVFEKTIENVRSLEILN